MFTISLKKTNVMAQGTDHPPSITIDGHVLEAVDDFTFLRSTISSLLTLETEISSRIAKAAAVMSKLHQRVWNNLSLTVKTKLHVCQACVLSTLLYSSKAWTPCVRQERRLNSFYLRCLRRTLHIRWQDRVTDVEVLQQAGMTSMMSILHERRLRWLGHVCRMEPGRIPKDLLYGQLAVGTRLTERPRLRYKDVCKRYLKECQIDVLSWERLAEDRALWRLAVRKGVHVGEDARNEILAEKRARRKKRECQPQQPSTFICVKRQRDCHSWVGLYSHLCRCR